MQPGDVFRWFDEHSNHRYVVVSAAVFNQRDEVLVVPMYSYDGDEAEVERQAQYECHVLVEPDGRGITRRMVACAEDLGPVPVLDRIDPEAISILDETTMFEIRRAIGRVIEADLY